MEGLLDLRTGAFYFFSLGSGDKDSEVSPDTGQHAGQAGAAAAAAASCGGEGGAAAGRLEPGSGQSESPDYQPCSGQSTAAAHSA